MNTEITPPESATPEAPPQAAPRSGGLTTMLRSAGAHRAFFLALVAVAFGALWLDARVNLGRLQDELARRLGESDTQTKEARGAARQTQESVQTLQGRVGALEAGLAESQGQRLAIEAMYQELARSRDERVIAEVEQSVSIAAQQLQLAGNVEAALIALQGADARLARAANPQFLGVRKLIARDIDRLRALPTADVPGMALKLEGIVAAIDSMPLAYEQRPLHSEAAKKPAAAGAEKGQPAARPWEKLGAELWAELRQLVRVERMDGAGVVDPGLLSPSQSFFLRENLKLRLVSARLALLTHDAKSFRTDMRQAHEWLERYFDGRAKPVQAALTLLKTLGAADVAVAAPSVNETLTALRSFKSTGK